MARDSSILTWPSTLPPVNTTITIDRPLFKGPKPLSGREQIVAHSAGGWMVSYENIPIFGSKYRTYKSLWIDLAGNGAPIYIKPEYSVNSLAARNGYTGSSPTDCTLAANCAQYATTLTVTNSSTLPVQVGDYFEIDGRLHIVKSISGSTWTIWPPTRAAYTSGKVFEIADPRLLATMVPDSKANALSLDMGRISRVSIDFIEAGW